MQYEPTKPEREWRQKIFETITERGPIGLETLTEEVDIPLDGYRKRRFVEVNANLMTVKRTIGREGSGTRNNPFRYSPIHHHSNKS
jgi:hypothetical protein